MPKHSVTEPIGKHTATPGPWLHGKASDDIITLTGDGIASPCDGYDEDQWAADAALIAAAPDFLAASRSTVDRLDDLARFLRDHNNRALCGIVLEELAKHRAAIAKADGRVL